MVLPIVCRRRSPPSLPPPSRSRSSLLPRGSTPSGSEDPSWPPCPPSSRCGSPSGVRRVRPLHCPPQVLLNVVLIIPNNYCKQISFSTFQIDCQEQQLQDISIFT